MRRFENKFIDCTGSLDDFRRDADALGREGWEVVSVFPFFRAEGVVVVAWLKRELPGAGSGGRKPNAERAVLAVMSKDPRKNTARQLSDRSGFDNSALYRVMQRLQLRKKVVQVNVDAGEGLGQRIAWKLL